MEQQEIKKRRKETTSTQGSGKAKGKPYKFNIRYINKLVALTQNNQREDDRSENTEMDLDELLFERVENPLKVIKKLSSK